MADVRKGSSNRGRSDRGGGYDRRRWRNSWRGGPNRRFRAEAHKTFFSETDSREDHYGIKMQGIPAECDICCHKSDLFAVGPCLHPICMECGIRLRILCKNETCPKCRADIDKMCFVTYTGEWSANSIDLKNSFPHKDADRYKLCFENEFAAKCFDNYLKHSCPICKKKGEPKEFPSFAFLNQHVYMVHRFEYCNICVEHLDLLSHERRVYSQLDLERHINKGDMDDTSQKGHPKCLFCDKRFYDDEFRYKHLRKEHFFCQICDADGISNYFFPEHCDLIKHYKKKHIICEEGECKHLGIAFRTDLDLKVHKSTHHVSGRQNLNLDFHFDRGMANANSSGRGGFRRGAPAPRLPRIGVIPNENSQEPQRTSDSVDVRIVPSMQAQGMNFNIRNSSGLAFQMQKNEFPRLGAGLKQPSKNPTGQVSYTTSKASANVNNSKQANENVSVTAASSSNEPNPSTSWFIDDDEVMERASHWNAERREAAIRLAQEHRDQGHDQDSALEPEEPIEPPTWEKRGQQALTKDAFPSLVSANPVKNLLVNSAWRKNNLHFPNKSDMSQIVSVTVPKQSGASQTVSCAVPQGGWRRTQPKRLPEPDIWPKQNVPSNWEDTMEDSVEENKQKLKVIVVPKETNKRKRGKKEKAKSERQTQEPQPPISDSKGKFVVFEVSSDERTDSEDQLSDSKVQLSDRKDQLPDVTSDENKNAGFLGPSFSSALGSKSSNKPPSLMNKSAEASEDFPSLLTASSQPTSVSEEQPKLKSAPSFTEILSSTFSSWFGNPSKTAGAESSSRLGADLDGKVLDEKEDDSLSFSVGNVERTATSSLPPPPGIEPLSAGEASVLPPPPGFGPPPGFESFRTT